LKKYREVYLTAEIREVGRVWCTWKRSSVCQKKDQGPPDSTKVFFGGKANESDCLFPAVGGHRAWSPKPIKEKTSKSPGTRRVNSIPLLEKARPLFVNDPRVLKGRSHGVNGEVQTAEQ